MCIFMQIHGTNDKYPQCKGSVSPSGEEGNYTHNVNMLYTHSYCLGASSARAAK